MADENYRDQDGNPIVLDVLVRSEPEWAANVIRTYKRQAAERDATIARLREALEFYGAAERYAGLPNGQNLFEDASWVELEGQKYFVPGKRAREALGK